MKKRTKTINFIDSSPKKSDMNVIKLRKQTTKDLNRFQ